MESVLFITSEDDEPDQIISFALTYGEGDIRSLILLRTPKDEAILDEIERGVWVSLEGETGDEFDILETVRIERNRVRIETRAARYDLDIGRVDPVEVSDMKALFGRMNFDDRFRIEEV